MNSLADLRSQFHAKLGTQIVRFWKKKGRLYPNFSDGDSRSSVEIANTISEMIGFAQSEEKIKPQTLGREFENIVRNFISESFKALIHLRPGDWLYFTSVAISEFMQYEHMDTLSSLVESNPSLSSAIGHGYIVKPDIVVARRPVQDAEFNHKGRFLNKNDTVARLSPFRASNQSGQAKSFLHASISCKWTIRSDRSQNTRTEALNLIRNRKGSLPHIVAVTAEPLPMRIASLALGTGDLDCVYHFALHELREACATIHRGDDQLEMLETMIHGNRLRDISDLPFDLAVGLTPPLPEKSCKSYNPGLATLWVPLRGALNDRFFN